MQKKFNNKPGRASHEIFSLIGKISNPKKKNLLRGACAKGHITVADITALRKNNSSEDNLVIGAILKGPHGLQVKSNENPVSSDIYKIIQIPPLDLKSEICFTCGYVNSEAAKALTLLVEMEALAYIESLSSNEALLKLEKLGELHGASNYLSYKLAYLKSSRELSVQNLAAISRIEDVTKHRKSPGFHFSAQENLSSKISLFLVARRRINGLAGKVGDKFRNSISLSNFVPTPLDSEDVPGFLLRATESSFIDTVHALVVIFNLQENLTKPCEELICHLSPEVLGGIESLRRRCLEKPNSSPLTNFYHSQNVDSDYSLDLYRISSAFLERKRYAEYRSKLDKVIGSRLLIEATADAKPLTLDSFDDKEILTAPDGTAVDSCLPEGMDGFYRTYLFLRFVSDRHNIVSLRPDEIRFLFENTIALESLMLEDEIRALYLTAPRESKSLVAVLALALFRRKSIDPDIDFEFRSDFISHVDAEYSGSIPRFIDSLLSDSPSIANYIVSSLDEVTLEKMYTLIANAAQASEVRRDILKAIGLKLHRIEYIIEAEGITTRSKVAKLQQYFDTSRMYVDSVAMKAWLDRNPSVFTEQYRDLYPKISARLLSESEKNSVGVDDSSALIFKVENPDEFLVGQIAKEAFEEFCLNTEFGIQSYLGRRIRHNTLHGVMTETVDAVFNKEKYRSLSQSSTFKSSVQAWLNFYKSLVEKLRKEQLQFKSNASLFSSTLDLDESITRENVRQLTNTLRFAGGAELLNDLIISFCWKQISPQLEKASRFIKTDLLNEANSSIDHHFARHLSAAESGLKSELLDAINEVFRKVASWFQVPQTGFIPASIRELCQIILLDLGKNETSIRWEGEGLDKKYTGISVHRIYDCLAVLLQNAFQHGEENKAITICLKTMNMPESNSLDFVTISVASIASEESYFRAKERLNSALESRESGADMVNEGYSGIKKVKFITRINESAHTVRFFSDDTTHSISLEFSLRAENAIEQSNG